MVPAEEGRERVQVVDRAVPLRDAGEGVEAGREEVPDTKPVRGEVRDVAEEDVGGREEERHAEREHRLEQHEWKQPDDPRGRNDAIDGEAAMIAKVRPTTRCASSASVTASGITDRGNATCRIDRSWPA